MARTFEELVGTELDALYQGALFLTGGDAPGAERLMVETVTSAFEDHSSRADADVPSTLERRLVDSFLRAADDASPRKAIESRSVEPAELATLGPNELFVGARALPHPARAAIWLVLLRRWPYAEAREALGVSRDGLLSLLDYRDLLMLEMVRSVRGRPRSTESGGA